MIDHTGYMVSNVDKSIAFYERVLAPLGYKLVMRHEAHAGFGVDGKPDFWIAGNQAPTDKIHIAFRAGGRAQVRAFYDAAIAAGAKDNGAPGVRAHYHEHYYGAFVLDPDGHNVEAVCHDAFLG